jgi:hypothetical protein
MMTGEQTGGGESRAGESQVFLSALSSLNNVDGSTPCQFFSRQV